MPATSPPPSSDLPDFDDVVAELFDRTPESDIVPTLDRVARVMELLGDPQRSPRIVQVTGTNGKTSTARMIETLVLAAGLRVGTFTSPHLHTVTERIRIDGQPIAPDRFVEVAEDIRPIVALVDTESEAAGGPPLTFFEVLTCIGFAAFADAPVDVAVIEVGLGGTWDATNVADADVAVITPIALDHERWLGRDVVTIATEKAGIVKAGSIAVTGPQDPVVLDVIAARCSDVGAELRGAGPDFEVTDRVVAFGGQVVGIRTGESRYDEVFLPLYGRHQADNAALAVAAAEALLVAGDPFDTALVDALGSVRSPGRLEVVHRDPTVLVDAAHNPAGAESLAEALRDSFTFRDVTLVVACLADKDAGGILAPLTHLVNAVIVTTNSSPRCLSAAQLGQVAEAVFGAARVAVVPDLPQAVAHARQLAESSGGAVVATGSVVTAADVRTMFGLAVADPVADPGGDDEPDPFDSDPEVADPDLEDPAFGADWVGGWPSDDDPGSAL